MTDKVISVERVIPAPAQQIFDIESDTVVMSSGQRFDIGILEDIV